MNRGTPPPLPIFIESHSGGPPSLYSLDRRVQAMEHHIAAQPEKLAERLIKIEGLLGQMKWLIVIIATGVVGVLINSIASRVSVRVDPGPATSQWKVPEHNNLDPGQP